MKKSKKNKHQYPGRYVTSRTGSKSWFTSKFGTTYTYSWLGSSSGSRSIITSNFYSFFKSWSGYF